MDVSFALVKKYVDLLYIKRDITSKKHTKVIALDDHYSLTEKDITFAVGIGKPIASIILTKSNAS